MQSRWLVLLLGVAASVSAQTLTRQNLAAILGFENGTPGQFPAGWGGNAGAAFIDSQVFHSGKYSCRIDRTSTSSGTFSTISASIPLDFIGQTITWRGWIKMQNVSDYVALWLREDAGSTPSVSFATMQGQNIGGTRDWAQYSVSTPVVSGATSVIMGFFVSGSAGSAWVDDLELLVDGVPVAQAPAIPAAFTSDHEFDNGSKISITSLTDAQVQNLATLAKVWGFLKYHHPAVTSGKLHWDYELFRIMPKVLTAADSATASQAISTWISGIGPVTPCTACAKLDSSDLYLGTNLDWMEDATLLGADLSKALQSIYQNRSSAAKQFYVELAANVGNPQFDDELAYPGLKLPDSGYQLLALFRYWNMVQYFYPNRDIMADDPAGSPNYWDDVLTASIRGIALAPDSVSYQQQLMKFIANIHDTHANLWSSISTRPPMGACQLPVDVRFVEGQPIVVRWNSKTAGPASGLMPGDIIQELDGVSIGDLIAQWTPFYADSNDAARMRDIGLYMTRGACGAAQVTVDRGDGPVHLTTNRVPTNTLDLSASSTHDRPGDTFQMLTPDVAYLKLSSVKAANSASYIQSAAGTKGLVIDIRNYPSEFVVFTLGDLLASAPADFVRFTQGDIANPGAFHWLPTLGLTPQQPHYGGKVIVLVDEITQSQAEYTTMAFRAAGAIVIGSTTAGADGNVSTIPLPGNLSSYISGIGVFYPDNTPTQRVGIIPDIVVPPTIDGIRAGRDELIEEAMRQITGGN
jgi:hypothetical protein